MPTKTKRTKLIQLIHVGKRELGLADENYRMILGLATGKESCSEMSVKELEIVLDRLKSFGFKYQAPVAKGKKKLSPVTRSKPEREKNQIDKIRALWIELYNAGVIKNRYESGLRKFVQRMYKVEHLEWLSWQQAQKVIEALKAMQERVQSKEAESNG